MNKTVFLLSTETHLATTEQFEFLGINGDAIIKPQSYRSNNGLVLVAEADRNSIKQYVANRMQRICIKR